jgi:hypothetical protein
VDRPEGTPDWHARGFFALHYDLHANAEDTELGRDLTHEHLREEILRVGPDWIQCDCKGHPGYTSYPTEVGIPSPGIVQDALRIHREVTRELGLPLVMHYSGVWDDAAMAAHPDWRRIGPDGSGTSRLIHNREAGRACLTGPYTDEYMIPQLLEIIDRYDVDGFWVDGENWATEPCYCDRCRTRFAASHGGAAAPTGPDEPHWAEWLTFHRGLFEAHVRRYTEAVHARKPDCLVCSNWMYSMRQPDPVAVPVDYLSGDFDHAFGGARAAVEARMLDGRDLPWNLMAWSFLSGERDWGGWTAKSAPHLCQEAAEVLACGGRVILYETPQRSGHLIGWHHEIMAEVARFCRARQSIVLNSTSVPQAAVLHGAAAYYRHNRPLYNPGTATEAVEGALHALLDAGYHADVITERALVQRLAEYPLLVIPEQDPLSPDVVALLPDYVRGGGRVIVSGAHVAVTLADLVGVEAAGAARDGYHYLPSGEGAVTVAGPWQPVALHDAQPLLALLAGQEPGRDALGSAAATVRGLGAGCVVAVYGPIFADYYRTRYPRLRETLAGIIAATWPEPRIHLDTHGAIALSLRRQRDRLIVHLLNRAGDPPTGPHRVMVERVPPTGPVTVQLRCPLPRRVYAVPDEPQLTTRWSGGVLTATVPSLGIHAAIVVECEPGA